MSHTKDIQYQMPKLVTVIKEIMQELAPYCEAWNQNHPSIYLRNPNALHPEWMMVIGSFRRKMELYAKTEKLMRYALTVGDIELAVVEKDNKLIKSHSWDTKMSFERGGAMSSLEGRDVYQGDLYNYLFLQTKKATSNWKVRKSKDGKKVFGAENKLLVYKDEYKIDIFSCNPQNFTSTAFVHTGSRNNNVSIMTRCQEKGVRFDFKSGWFEVGKPHPLSSEYAERFSAQALTELNEKDSHVDRYSVDSEQMIYDFLELPYKAPGHR